jgi:hypothetical protein
MNGWQVAQQPREMTQLLELLRLPYYCNCTVFLKMEDPKSQILQKQFK